MKKDKSNLLVLSFLFLAYFFCSQCASQNITDLSPEITKRARLYLNQNTRNNYKALGKPMLISHHIQIPDRLSKLEETRTLVSESKKEKSVLLFNERGQRTSFEKKIKDKLVDYVYSEYDEKGNLIAEKTKRFTRFYEYDENNLLTKEYYDNLADNVHYKVEGLVETQTVYNGETLYSINTITYNSDSLIHTYFYDDKKNEGRFSNLDTYEYASKNHGWESSLTAENAATGKVISENTYDINGFKTDTKHSVSTMQEPILYKHQNQFFKKPDGTYTIVHTTYQIGDEQPTAKTTYELDQRGNWIKKTSEEEGIITEIRERVISYRN